MNSVNKTLTLTLIVLLLSSLMVLSVTPVAVQAVSKPSVPQFSIKFVDYSYDVPPTTTTTTNPYTGEKTTTTNPGYHVKDMKIEVTIKNQPFTPYTENGIKHNMGYKVESKGHFSEDWSHWGSTVDMYIAGMQPEPSFSYSQDSVIYRSADTYNYVAGDQLDFRVEAVVGYYVPINPDSMFPQLDFETVVSSGWSKVQTFTIPGASSSSPSQTTTIPSQSTAPDNNQSQLPYFVFSPTVLLWIGTFLFVGVVIAVVMVFLRRHLKTLNFNNLTYTA